MDLTLPAFDLPVLTLPPRVTDRARARLDEIGARVLRVAVEGGGCSGFKYDFRLEDAPAPDDLVLGDATPHVVVDPASLPFLSNAVIDYSEALIGARFVVENPNATASCGCGTSFSV